MDGEMILMYKCIFNFFFLYRYFILFPYSANVGYEFSGKYMCPDLSSLNYDCETKRKLQLQCGWVLGFCLCANPGL